MPSPRLGALPLRVIYRRVAGPLVLVAAIAGCDQLSQPAEPSLGATVLAGAPVYFEATATFDPGGCVDEPITVSFRESFRFQVVESPDAVRTLTNMTIVERGSSAVGTETGTVYRHVGGAHEAFSTGLNGTATYVATARYIGRGNGANFSILQQLHFTITPSGDITAELDRFEASC